MHQVGRLVPRVGTLVVGGGPATSSLLANVILPRHARKPANCDFNVVRFQPDDSMWGRFPGGFEMGQPPSILVTTRYQENYPKQLYMKVAEFNRYQKQRDKDNLAAMEATEVSARVLKIKKWADNDFQAVYVDRESGSIRELQAQKVYFSPGPCAEKSILSEVPRSPRSSRLSRSFAEYPGAVSILTSQVTVGSGGVVAIIGDGPTALWVAKMIADMGNKVVVLGPDHPSAFCYSNPGGRNSEILHSLGDNFYVGTMLGIEEREVSNRADWEEAGTTLVVANFRPHDFKTKGKTAQVPVTAIVSAMGSTPGFAQEIDPGLLLELTVLPGAGALATPSEDFFLFGAGAFDGAKSRNQATLFDRGKQINQPPVGIATQEMNSRELSQTLKDAWKLEQRVGLDDIHLPTATGEDLRNLLRGLGVDHKGADEMTTQIVARRSKVSGQREYTNRDFVKDLQTLFSGKPVVETGTTDAPSAGGTGSTNPGSPPMRPGGTSSGSSATVPSDSASTPGSNKE